MSRRFGTVPFILWCSEGLFITIYGIQITEANGCNAKESKTPYYSRTPKDEGHSPETSGHMFKFFGTLNNVLNFNFLFWKFNQLVLQIQKRAQNQHACTAPVSKREHEDGHNLPATSACFALDSKPLQLHL